MPSGVALLITPDRLRDPAAVVMGLARRDLAVVWSQDMAEAVEALTRERAQVVYLDLATSAPTESVDGSAQLCQRLRVLTQVPILVAGTAQEKPRLLRALEVGADAFLLKPLDGDFLVAALAALSRRQTLEEPSEPPEIVRVRELEIDRSRCEVRLDQVPVALTPTEFRILGCLGRNLGRVVSARQILQEAQGYPCTEREAQQIVKVHVRHLRRKLQPPDGERPYVTNVRGFGYLLERRATPRPDDFVVALADDGGE